MPKQRIDLVMVQRGLAQSREKAQAQIMAGNVWIEGRRVEKPSFPVDEQAPIDLREEPAFVSRGGYKLEKALGSFQVPVQGRVAMDIGAATGGFTDVLLQAGAMRVYAIDVGYGQLDWRLRNDPRVVVMERTNARYLKRDDFPIPPDLCVMDVSFISIELILPAVMGIIGTGGRIVSLVKPQFEAGRENVGKKGVVRDPAVHEAVLRCIHAFIEVQGWCIQGIDYSPITGPEGNIEFLMDAVIRDGARERVTPEGVSGIVTQAHEHFLKKR